MLPIATTIGILVFQFSRGNYFVRKCAKCGATDLSECKRELVAWHPDASQNPECKGGREQAVSYITTVENVTYHCNVCTYNDRVIIRRVCQEGNFKQNMLSQ